MFNIKLSFTLALTALSSSVFAQTNLYVARVGTGGAAASTLSNASTATFLDGFSFSDDLLTATYISSIALPTSISGGNRAFGLSGTATSEGMLNLSADGRYLTLGGYDATPGTTGPAGGSIATSTNSAATTSSGTDIKRVVARVDSSGNVDTSTVLTNAYSGNNIRSVVTSDGTNIFAVGASAPGTAYTTLGSVGAVTQLSTTVTNIRTVDIFGGQLFISTSSGNAVRVGTVGTGTPTTSGQTITNLPGFPTSGSPYQFFFADLDKTANFNGTGLDTLYVADDGTTGGIQKYSYSGNTWTASGFVTASGVRGLTGRIVNGNVQLFGTTGITVNTGVITGVNSLYTLNDLTGYNGSIAGSANAIAAANIANYTVTGNFAFRGIDFAPSSVTVTPESNSLLLAGLGLMPTALIAVRRRKKARNLSPKHGTLLLCRFVNLPFGGGSGAAGAFP